MNRSDLVRALTDRHVADWVLTTRDQELAVVGPELHRRELRSRWSLVVHDDVSNGRGSARLELTGADGNANDVVDGALAVAHASIGAPWRTRPPAAPAHVDLHDPALDVADLVGAAAAVARGAAMRKGIEASATVLRESVNVETHQGLKTSWIATHVRVDLTIANGDHSVELSREARRVSDLALDDAVAAALADLAARDGAGDPAPGPCTLLVGVDALLHGGGYGMWAVFASQADAILEREGLTRYHEGIAVAPGADAIADPLSIASDGALDHGTLSAPVGDDGDAIRKFSLVERGVASGLGLSPREAAFRKRDPNGGVRNLVVSLGSLDKADGARVVEVRRLRSLAIDPYTGDASFEIALGIDHATGKPFAGGTVRLDLIAALAKAKRSATPVRRGPYSGPTSVQIDDAELLG